MTPEQFAYWLNGFVELSAGEHPTPEQWMSITEHLKTVFKKVTPAYQSPSLGAPGLRTMELRPSDIAWPGGVAPVITC